MSKEATMTLIFPLQVKEEMERICERVGLEQITDVVRQALALYDTLTEAQFEEGATIIIRRSDGAEETLRIALTALQKLIETVRARDTLTTPEASRLADLTDFERGFMSAHIARCPLISQGDPKAYRDYFLEGLNQLQQIQSKKH